MTASKLDDVRASTVEFWQPHYPDDELSTVDADSMIRGVSEFISILAEWETNDEQRKAQRRHCRRKLSRLRNKIRREPPEPRVGGAV